MSTRNEVQAHQDATDCDDREMLAVVSSWLDKLFAEHPNTRMGDEFLEESFYLHVADCLSRLPGDVG